MLIMNENIGVVIAFYCDFYVTPIAVIVLIIIFVVSFSFFPESPTYLIKRNKISVSMLFINAVYNSTKMNEEEFQ